MEMELWPLLDDMLLNVSLPVATKAESYGLSLPLSLISRLVLLKSHKLKLISPFHKVTFNAIVCTICGQPQSRAT